MFKGIVKNLDCLAVGIVGAKDRIHSGFGRKIEKTIEYNEQGSKMHIFGEDDWVKKHL